MFPAVLDMMKWVQKQALEVEQKKTNVNYFLNVEQAYVGETHE